MLPSNWPDWVLIPISLGLIVVAVLVGLAIEPMVQALAPQAEPTPQESSLPPRLPYAAPASDSCLDCHTDQPSLEDTGAQEDEMERLLIRPGDHTSVMSLHSRLGCVTCHGGVGETEDVEVAHEGIVPDPSHPEEAASYCLPCHHDLRSEIPEHNIRVHHDRILLDIEEGGDVCRCSNCHGPVAHGEEPIRTHEFMASYCFDCHEEQNVSSEASRYSACHIGPHDVSDALDCEVCHMSTELWSRVELAVHPMELNGRHAELECFECHVKPNFRQISGFTCADCHTKPHEFGGDDCAQCHVGGGDWSGEDNAGVDHHASWEGYRHHEHLACRACHFEGYDVELATECSGCHNLAEGAEEPGPTPEGTPAPEATADAGADEGVVLSEWVTGRLADWTPTTSAEALYENLTDGDETNDPFVVSVRAREHYELGHVPGAYNIPWRKIASDANLAYLPTDREIVVYCYTGHTGQVATTILNVLGYDVTNLKFGMMGWTDDADVLATDGFAGAGRYPVETEVNELGETYSTPVLDTGEGDAIGIAQARAESFLAEWQPTMDPEALFENLSDGDETNDPLILSVRSREHYEIGHVPGSTNVPWREVATAESLQQLPADAAIVTYCYTGDTGQVAATVLGMFGYDVTNLKYGMMGWTDDADVLATEPFSAPAGYPVETEPNELE
ncbi:MAG: rhodanese-like domain-containing protein [Chloroflexota bacterium]|nr:rhodanese-like domain-containing protein [Chloroflexota bacterium]